MMDHHFLTAAIILMASFTAAISGLGHGADGEPGSIVIASLFVPTVFPIGEPSRILVNVTAPEDLPNGSVMVINVTDPNGEVDQTRERMLPDQHEYAIPLSFSVPGRHEVIVGFESDGVYMDARSVECLAVVAREYQDWESASGWTFHGADPTLKAGRGDEMSPSGGKVLSIGSGSGPTFVPGFHGEMETYAQSPPIDLENSTEATLFMYHERSFQGPIGSCGGLVQVISGDIIETLTPEDGYDARLRDNISGGLGGQRAFSGDMGWSLSTFDLQAFLGSNIAIRIAAASDADGYGNWSVDDVFVESKAKIDDDPPGSITDLECVVGSDGTVRISWNAPPDDDVAGYNIYLSDSEMTDITGETPFDSILPDDDLEYTLVGLQKERSYWVAVTAYDGSLNERSEVDSISFIIEEAGPNKPPVAVIVVVSQAPYRVGSEIEFNAESSYDPEGDDITFSWMLPEGTRRIGDSMRWKPSEEGSAIIRLQARDQWGATNESYVELTVEKAGEGPIIEGDLMTFLTIAVPIAIVMILGMFVVAVVRSRRRRKLEIDLEEVGIVHRPQFEKECKPASGGGRVLDLVPVGKRTDMGVAAHRLGKGKVGGSAIGHQDQRMPLSPRPPLEAKQRKAYRPKDATEVGTTHLNVTIECTCCGRTFRQRMGRDSLKGHDVSVRCPHCGSEGEL